MLRVGMWRAMGERYELELSDRVGWGDLALEKLTETDLQHLQRGSAMTATGL